MIELSPEYAERFLRAGGRVDLLFFMGLNEESQNALCDAGDRLRAETVVEIIDALGSAILALSEEARLSALEQAVPE